jgi:hypothetical protein
VVRLLSTPLLGTEKGTILRKALSDGCVVLSTGAVAR